MSLKILALFPPVPKAKTDIAIPTRIATNVNMTSSVTIMIVVSDYIISLER